MALTEILFYPTHLERFYLLNRITYRLFIGAPYNYLERSNPVLCSHMRYVYIQ